MEWKEHYAYLNKPTKYALVGIVIATAIGLSTNQMYSHYHKNNVVISQGKIDITEPTTVTTEQPTETNEQQNNEQVIEQLAMNQIPSYDISLSQDLQKLIYDLCQKNGLSYELVLGFFHWESQGFNVNAINHNTDGTTDYGIAQINSKYIEEYHKWAIEYCDLDPNVQFNPLNPEHGIRAGIGGLTYWRDYWQNKGMTDPYTLTKYMLNSYNMGGESFRSYVNKTGSTSRGYDREIESRENKLITEGRIDNN